MKIAFDENVLLGMVRVFRTLATERKMLWSVAPTKNPSDRGTWVIVSAKDYAPDPTDQDYASGSDAPRIDRFAKDGGEVIISGDTQIMERPHEVVAMRRAGLTLVFFENNTNPRKG